MVKQFRSMTYPYVAWISVMIVLPMLLIVLYAFTVSGNEVLTFQFTFDNFKRFVTDTVFMEVLGRSLYIAVLTTLICIALGYPIAYAIAQMNSRSNTIMILLITMPTWVNMLVRTYAWMGILQDEGILNTILGFFGIGPVSMIHTSFAVILGMVYNFIPFMILQIHTSLAKMDKSLLEAANDLGATPVQAFLRVTLPLSLPCSCPPFPASLFQSSSAAASSCSSATSSNRSSSPPATGTSAALFPSSWRSSSCFRCGSRARSTCSPPAAERSDGR